MKINKKVIAALNPCTDRFNNYVSNHNDTEFELAEFLNLETITYSDKIWVITKLFTHEQNVKWSIACASSVLDNFEKIYPEDKRPRLAIEAATAFAESPTEANRSAADSAYSAASAAYSAAYSAADSAYSAAASAAYSAAASAAYSAAESAYSAAASAYSAASAAYSAANSAAESAYSARSAARSAAEKEQENLNLILLLQVFELTNV